ncbi:MAG: nitroreductase family protein [Planctomycetia bacterium]|jgi:nitroreductase
MELFEAIAKRHSYRGEFTEQPVPREDLEKIVQAGIQAPSAKNEQVTKFVIVDDPAVIAKLAQIIDRPVVQTARAIIVCITDPRPVFHGMSFDREDVSAAVENMLLSITSLGYASVWLDGVLRLGDTADRIAELLGVPAGLDVNILLPLGVPVTQEQQMKKLPFDERAWYNRWGG